MATPYDELHHLTGKYVLEAADNALIGSGVPERIRAKVDKILKATSLHEAEELAKTARNSMDLNVLASSTTHGLSAAERLEECALISERAAAISAAEGDTRKEKSLRKEVERLRKKANDIKSRR